MKELSGVGVRGGEDDCTLGLLVFKELDGESMDGACSSRLLAVCMQSDRSGVPLFYVEAGGVEGESEKLHGGLLAIFCSLEE